MEQLASYCVLTWSPSRTDDLDRSERVIHEDLPMNVALETLLHSLLPAWKIFPEALAVTDLLPTRESPQRAPIWITAAYSLPMTFHPGLE